MDTAEQLNKPVSGFTQSSNDFITILNQLANWSGKPLVTKYDPSFIAPSSLTKDVTITVHGFKLHISDANPKLLLGNSQVIGEGTDNLVSFIVPRNVFGNLEGGTGFISATLILFEDNSHWYNPIDWYFPRLQERRFGLLFTMLPESLGSYKVNRLISYTKKEVKTFVSLPLATESSSVNGDVHGCYSPEDGWVFDTTGNNVQLKIDEKKGWYNKVSLSAAGLIEKVQSDGRNLGGITLWEERKSAKEICIRVMASIGTRDDGARTVGHLEVPMVRTVEETQPAESEDKLLAWERDSDEPLRPDAKTQELIITLFNKITYTLIASEPKRLPFLDIDPDIRGGKVYLRPVRQWVEP
jgi:hypothetical protein